MPKEQINYTQPEIDESGEHFQYGEIAVYWGKGETGGAVQIGMDIDGEYLRRRVSDSRAEHVTSYGFFTDGLTVAEINKMIKALLKAKEALMAQQAWESHMKMRDLPPGTVIESNQDK